jgi:hypothetical protein
LCPVSRHEQRFGTTVEVNILWVGEYRPQKSTDASTAWFTRDDCIQVHAETLCMRALPATLKAFQR